MAWHKYLIGVEDALSADKARVAILGQVFGARASLVYRRGSGSLHLSLLPSLPSTANVDTLAAGSKQ